MRLFLSILFLFSKSAFAGTQLEAQHEMVKSTIQLVAEIPKQREFFSRSNKSIEALIKDALEELKNRGYSVEAQYWEESYVNNFSTFGLGDHKPLNQWMIDFYNDLEKRLGLQVCRFFYFTDLLVFAYGIPVTFHPTGWQGDSWNKEEYKKHFVPTSAATTYWGAKIACVSATAGLTKLVCTSLAVVPRFAVRKFIAPSLSDKVYLAAFKVKTKPKKYNVSGAVEKSARENPEYGWE